MSELKPIKGKLLLELADVWENEGVEAQSPERRAAFREAADTLRTLAAMPRIDTSLALDRAPTHRCTHCGAFWIQWTDSWSLCSKDCGPCCDNSPDFLNVITPLIVSDIYTRPQPSAEPVAYLYESEFGDKDLLLSCDGELARRLIELGRTEAPLYPASALEAARREALPLLQLAIGALTEAREALHFHYVEWDGEPEDAVPLQLARAKCDQAISALKENTNAG